MKTGEQFVENLKSSDKIILVHHKDADGIYSAAIALTALNRLGKKVDKVVAGTTEKDGGVLQAIKNYDKVIIVDIGIDLFLDYLNKSAKEILYIDHHLVPDDVIGEHIVYINPRLDNLEIYQPATYVVYKFFSRLVDLSDKEWLAVIGTVGDYGFEDCRDLLDKYIKVKEKRDIWKTKYGRAAIETLGSTTKIGFDKLLKILVESKDFNDLIENNQIQDGYKEYEKLYEDDKKIFIESSEEIGNLIFSVASYKLERVGSAIATETATKYPNKIIFLLEKLDEFYKIHARYQEGKIHLGELLRKMGIGGGHRQAAGGKIEISQLNEFKKNLLDELGIRK